jgi:long-chain acyl-CoA synthetase
MGAVQSLADRGRLVPTGEPGGPGESPVYRSSHCYAENGGELISTFAAQPVSFTPIELLRRSSITHPERDCVGQRTIRADGTPGGYVWTSYKTFYARCLAMGRALLLLGLQRGDRIGIYSSNSQYWQMASFGAYTVGMVTVPVYDSLGKGAAQYITNHAEVQVLFVSPANFEKAISIIPELETLKHIVVCTDGDPPSAACELPIHSAGELLRRGEASDAPLEFSQPDELAVIMYTSGSLGVPKGCELTGRNVVGGASSLAKINASIGRGDTFLSFLPLAHIYGMAIELFVYATGARVGFARGPVKDLVSDIQSLQPTLIIVVPRLVNRICEGMKAKIAEKPAIVRAILRWAMNQKVAALRQNGPHSIILDALLFTAFREALGGCVRLLINSGAPILKDVFEFFCATVTPNVIQGYGLTETCCGITVQEVPAFDPTTVGSVGQGCDIKLRAVEGTHYSPAADPPSGELLVRGPVVFRGYYKQPALTDSVFTDRWFATGDVCSFTPEGEVKVIDRVKQLVKLSQGEYLSMTALNDYYGCADIAQFVFVYAHSMYDQPIAVVFPKPEKILEWEGAGIKDIKNDPRVHKEITESLARVHEERKLRGFERIAGIIVDTVEPTIENGLLTPSMKPQYAAFKRKYEADLLALYERIRASP